MIRNKDIIKEIEEDLLNEVYNYIFVENFEKNLNAYFEE